MRYSTVEARQRAGGYDCFGIIIPPPTARQFSQKKLLHGAACPGLVTALREGGCGAGHDLCREALSSRPERHVPVWVTSMEVNAGAHSWS